MVRLGPRRTVFELFKQKHGVIMSQQKRNENWEQKQQKPNQQHTGMQQDKSKQPHHPNQAPHQQKKGK